MAGTIKRVSIDGSQYNVKAESDATLMGGSVENAPIPHGGGNAQKQTRRPDSITGLILALEPGEHARLKARNDKPTKKPGYPLSVTDNEDNTYKSSGFINYQGMTTMENTGTVDLIPMVKEGFTLFEA
jgi:hypothetical protein